MFKQMSVLDILELYTTDHKITVVQTQDEALTSKLSRQLSSWCLDHSSDATITGFSHVCYKM